LRSLCVRAFAKTVIYGSVTIVNESESKTKIISDSWIN